MRITLITVCYNSAEVIRTALESVLRQTWPEIEYLVIDGGSTDGTQEILREYEKKFIRSFVRDCMSENADACADLQRWQSGKKALRQFIWVSEPDQGMYDAINKGIRMATGEVVGILNADDALADDGVIARVAVVFWGEVTANPANLSNGEIPLNSGTLKPAPQARLNLGTFEPAAFAAIEPGRRPVDVVYGDIRFVANRKDVGLDGLRTERTVRYYSAQGWRPWMLRWGFMPPHPSVYIRRECFERLGDYALDYQIAADYALLVRFLRRAGLRAQYLPLCMVVMRMGGKSTRGWRSNLKLNQEIVRGNREAGYFCCLPMLLPKYAFKVWEFLGPRVRGFKRG